MVANSAISILLPVPCGTIRVSPQSVRKVAENYCLQIAGSFNEQVGASATSFVPVASKEA